MTDHLVQCFDNNGEPYGRYVNPHREYIKRSPPECLNVHWYNFEFFAKVNTFPMPGAEIGKTYEREEVEVVEQYKIDSNYFNFKWSDHVSEEKKEIIRRAIEGYRSIFRLTQPVEKEPETVEQAAKLSADQNCSNSMSIYEAYQKAFKLGADWQKKQTNND